MIEHCNVLGVPGVPGVQASNDGASSRNTPENQGVPGVPKLELNPTDPHKHVPDADEIDAPEIKRPCFLVHDDWYSVGHKPGLYWHGETKGSETKAPEPVDKWICSPIHINAIASGEHGADFGRQLRIMDSNGQWKEWLMPMEMLKGSGEDLRGELLKLGWIYDLSEKQLFNRWLMSQSPKNRVTAAIRTGWHADCTAFVFPGETLGDDNYLFQSEHAVHDYYAKRGSLTQWRDNVATPCRGNPIMVLALSIAFAGPLILFAKQQSAGGSGVNLTGNSSKGKTTCLHVAGSVWGPPEFIRTWSATANGLEAVAASMNDTLLCLDEIGQSDPQQIGSVVYLIANGHGKQRASRTGGIRHGQKWRLMMLSSGERTLEAHMAEGGKRTKAGQTARLLDIPATDRAHGAFDDLHGSPSGQAFADRIKQAASKHYGQAGPEFIRQLIGKPGLRDIYADICKLPEFDTNDGLEARAAGTFALIAMAGELATEFGITGWREGEALDAAVEGFNLWRNARGKGNTETRQILESVREFIDAHGDSRFSELGVNSETKTINRAGWWQDSTDGRIYYFTTGAIKEAGGGFDVGQVSKTLDQSGWLAEKGTGGKRSVLKRARAEHGSDRQRLYAVRPKDAE